MGVSHGTKRCVIYASNKNELLIFDRLKIANVIKTSIIKMKSRKNIFRRIKIKQ
jgi:hypothetical protein